ncbi:nucleotidyltransferase domain-containing protein [Thermodesulfovibrio yellowstonii]|uniref:Nucleotidyltransferase n=1 Tax=Thermodesulfovibrio yellowstonii TaxID=28262 RepID=A0A9W6GHK4_9BACT|nr:MULTISPECIES: nucleotidyltransferase domain-containing protein [Thermodesulfovibrio]MDI6864303.1 nucleotidyltransferase domain-containing protein [Thermodesulfovibrio yellowstonii]GLI54029.1 nucleotidyltransferase [Thermodesulfovibrio islandicus]
MLEIPKNQKNQIIHLLKTLLHNEEKVIFAYLYGSFIEQDFFNDIDIAIYCSEIESVFNFQTDMKIKISDELINAGIDISPDYIDLRVINNAPYDFLIEVLDRGVLIVDKNPELRTNLIEKVSLNYRINQIVLSEFYK